MKFVSLSYCYLLISLLPVFVEPVSADLLASDSFSYPDGGLLAGNNGGTGWAGAWATVEGTVAPTVAGGLGQSAHTNTGPFGTFVSSQASRMLAAARGDGTTTWIRFSGGSNNVPNSENFGGLGLYEGFGERALFGKVWQRPGNWSIVSSGDYPTSVPITPALSDVWVKIVNGIGNTDSAFMWVNPTDTTSEAALGTAMASATNRNLNFNMVLIRSGSQIFPFNVTYQFDNLLIGDSFASVSIPEPGSIAILTLLSIAAISTRRRRRSEPDNSKKKCLN
jgi:hypothetical protein